MMENLSPGEARFSGAWLELEDRPPWPLHGNCRLGRATENDVIIEHEKVSRYHAIIHAQDEKEFWLIDVGSRNGTYLNGGRLFRPTQLRHRDTLRIGGQSFTFCQPSAVTPPGGAFTPANGEATTIATGLTVPEIRQQKTWLLIADIEKYTDLIQHWEADRVAIGIGRWFGESQRLVRKRHGRIAKYLGDAFLACWEEREEAARQVAAILGDFREKRRQSDVKFRVALHYGTVNFGGLSDWGEESMFGTEINFVFRLEDLASRLGLAFCLSSAAQAALGDLVTSQPVDGEHLLKGFDGAHRCYAMEAEV